MLRASQEGSSNNANHSASPMMSGSGVAIGSQDSAPEFKRVLDKSLSLLLDEAANIQRNILTLLEREYHEELTPGHTPSWYDIHKKRHVKKVDTAKFLKALCQKELRTLADVEQFISCFRQAENKNASLDKKGGKLGKKILAENSVAVGTLDGNVFTIKQDLSRINDYTHIIITQLIAAEMETEATLRFKYAGRLRENAAHIAEIMRFKDMLVNLYLSKAYMANVDQRQKETIAKQKVDAYLNEIRDALDEVESQSMRRAVKSSQKCDDRSVDAAVASDKVSFLGSISRNNLIEKIIRDLPSLRNGMEPLSAKDRIKVLVLDLLMKEFASMVKISDKVLLWEHVVREDNNLDGNLAPDQKRLRENFYINCYRDEIIDPNQSKKREIMTAAEREAAEDAEISQIILEETGRKSISKKSVSSSMPRRYENYKDFFSTNQFVMDLSSITTWLFTAGKPVDIEEIIQRVRLSLRSHMENHLGKLTDAHMQGFVAAWKRKLTDLVEDFINRLVMANNLIERIEAERTIAPRNRLEDEIMHVIATFAALAQPVPFISEQDIERAHLGISVARQGLFSASLPNHPAGHAQVRLGPPSNPVGHSEVWPSDNVDQNSETLIPGMNITQTL